MDEDDSVIDITHQDHNIYDSGMHMADAMVKQIVDELSGLWDNTIIVLLSDHGEEMFDDDLPYKCHGPNHGYHPYGDGQHHVMLVSDFLMEPSKEKKSPTQFASLILHPPSPSTSLSIGTMKLMELLLFRS